MAPKVTGDIYSQRTFVDLTMTAANTITFKKIDFAVGLFEGIALKIHRIEYHPTAAALRELVAATDMINFGLTTRNTLTGLDPTDLSVITSAGYVSVGAAVEPHVRPMVQDFGTLPQGGLLTLANPLYAACITVGAAAASQVWFVLHYTFVRLNDKESRELLQMMIPGNV